MNTKTSVMKSLVVLSAMFSLPQAFADPTILFSCKGTVTNTTAVISYDSTKNPVYHNDSITLAITNPIKNVNTTLTSVMYVGDAMFLTGGQGNHFVIPLGPADANTTTRQVLLKSKYIQPKDEVLLCDGFDGFNNFFGIDPSHVSAADAATQAWNSMKFYTVSDSAQVAILGTLMGTARADLKAVKDSFGKVGGYGVGYIESNQAERALSIVVDVMVTDFDTLKAFFANQPKQLGDDSSPFPIEVQVTGQAIAQ